VTGQSLGIAFNWWGGDGVIIATALLWIVSRALKRRRLALVGLRGVEGLALASAVSGILKGSLGRARPSVSPGDPWNFNFFHGWTDAAYFSMPSGHTTASFGAAVAMTIAVADWPTLPKWIIRVVMLTSAAMVAWARVATHQHWVSDVVVGALLGSTVATLVMRVHAKHPDAKFDHVMLGAK
jgi:membrane-associated phospholipid phosphatase